MTTKNVPLEPTEAMIDAGFPHIDSAYRRSSAEDCYAAMIAAAPSPDGDPVYFVKPLQYSLTDGPWVKTNETAYNLFHIEPVRRMKLYTSPRVVDVDAIAKALAESQGWAKWDTAQNCCDTLCGNEPEEEREHYRDTVKFVLAALGEGK